MSWRCVVICVTLSLSVASYRWFWECSLLIKRVDRKKTPCAGVLGNSTAPATRIHIENNPTLGECLCTPFVHGKWFEALHTRCIFWRLYTQNPNSRWKRISLIMFWQSTLLIKKLHFHGQRFLTGCGLNPCCVLPSLVLASEHRRQTTKGIKYFPLDREPRAQP